MSEAKARDSKFDTLREKSVHSFQNRTISHWCGYFLVVRLIPGHGLTAYKYGKDKYDKLPCQYESLLYQPDCQTYGNLQKPEYQLQEQHTDNKYR